MDCPRCGYWKHSVIRTLRFPKFDKRIVRCGDGDGEGCGCVFTTSSQVESVKVYNPAEMKEDDIPINRYKSDYLDHHVGRAPHPKQKGLFDAFDK